MSEHGAIHAARSAGTSRDRDHDNFDIRGSWNRLVSATWRHKGLVIWTTLATLGVLVLYIWIWPPVFQAELGFMVERDQDASRDTFYTGWAIFRKDDIESETMLMLSGPVLEDVARDLELTYDEVYHTFLGWAKHLWRESWPGKRYKELKEWIFPRPPSPYELTDEELELAKTLHDFSKGVSIRRLGESYVGLLEVKASSPRAAEMANAIFDRYRERRLERHLVEANKAYETLAREEADVRAELEAKEAELRTFFEESGLVFDFEREKIEVGKWIDMQATLVGSASSLAGIDARLAALDAQLAEEERERVGSRAWEQNKLRRELEMARIRYETALVETSSRFTPGSPEVQDIERNIASLTERIESTEEMVPSSRTEVMNSTYETLRSTRLNLIAERSGVVASRGVLIGEEQAMRERLEAVPGKRAGFEILSRDVGQLRNKFLSVHTRMIQADVARTTAESTMPSLRLVEYATAKAEPAWPRTKLLFLSALAVGLLLGVGVALVRDLYLGQVRLEDVQAGRGEAAFYARLSLGADPELYDLGPGSPTRETGTGGGD